MALLSEYIPQKGDIVIRTLFDKKAGVACIEFKNGKHIFIHLDYIKRPPVKKLQAY